jgi:hypothetical protein
MDRSALESLAGFLDQLSNPSFMAGDWVFPESDSDKVLLMPYVDFDDVVRNFIDSVYDNGWLDTRFDWPKWAGSPEAAQLQNDPHAIAAAAPQELSRLLTVCLRRDRFSEGALLEDFNSGLILRIVQRAAVLLGESSVVREN